MIGRRAVIFQPRTLLVVLTYVHLRFPAGRAPALAGILRGWLDTWAGLGGVVGGMIACGYDLELTRYGERGWRATFYPAGLVHSVTSAVGSAFAAAPWLAVQHAALAALLRSDAAA